MNIYIISSILMPIIVALLQVVKKAINIDDRFLPSISILIGILLMYLVSGQIIFNTEIEKMSIQVIIFAGIVTGLSSCGLYDFGELNIQLVSETIQKIRKNATK
jgi:uncharacterized membrane protein